MSKEMREYIDTFKQRLTESENISDGIYNFSKEELKDIATKFGEWILKQDWETTDLKMKSTAQLFDEFIKNHY